MSEFLFLKKVFFSFEGINFYQKGPLSKHLRYWCFKFYFIFLYEKVSGMNLPLRVCIRNSVYEKNEIPTLTSIPIDNIIL
jgi:hypothetical protein